MRVVRPCPLRVFFFPCSFFRRVQEVCFSSVREDEASLDLVSFRLDGLVGRRFGFRLGSNVEASVGTINPDTDSCLIGCLISRSIAINCLRS